MEDIKEEKKKKAYRKRDRFWKLLPIGKKPTLRKSESNDLLELKRTPEQTNKINSLSTYAQKNFSVSLDQLIFENILESNNWDYEKAMADLIDYEEASHGILVEPPASSLIKLLGSENDKGTSCYIDALLFAMYISNTTFDPLLTYDIPAQEEDKIKLQTSMRLFVNKLRKGHLINADCMHWLRKSLQESKWEGKDQFDRWAQADSSELFMFITQTFDLPYLPFQIRLFHGANKDTDDDRLMTDRTLTLSIPYDNGDTTPLQLQDILVDYFYNSIITGVKRQIDYNGENVVTLPSVTPSTDQQKEKEKEEKDTLKRLLKKAKDDQKFFKQNTNENESDDDQASKSSSDSSSDKEDEEEVAVTAWQVLELLPFYSATNEQGESISTQVDSSFPDTHMILPIVLKRYRYNNNVSSKIKRKVTIPVTIDFNKFVNQNAEDPLCSVCGHQIDWTLHFKSAVCHIGNSPTIGHYVAYALVNKSSDTDNQASEDQDNQQYKEPYWLKLDDMNTSKRVTTIKDNTEATYKDLAENAYIVFYELDKTCRHTASSIEFTDSEVEIREEMKMSNTSEPLSLHETDTEEQNDNYNDDDVKAQSSKSELELKPKLKSHKKHHHHHQKHNLNGSCSLM